MISDPRPTPNARAGRILFSLLTAAIAYYFRFKMFNPNGLLYSLVISSMFVPIIDRIFKGQIYYWNGRPGSGIEQTSISETAGRLVPAPA